LLDYIVPDFVHVLYDGRIVQNTAARNWHLSWKIKDMTGLRRKFEGDVVD